MKKLSNILVLSTIMKALVFGIIAWFWTYNIATTILVTLVSTIVLMVIDWSLITWFRKKYYPVEYKSNRELIEQCFARYF